MISKSGVDDGGWQVAEVLAKVVKQVSAAEAEAERRSGILDAIEELQTMRAECSWLAEYDRDDARYKVSVLCQGHLLIPKLQPPWLNLEQCVFMLCWDQPK